MNISELTTMLVNSSQRTNSVQFIPWWEGGHVYSDDIFEQNVVQDAEACLAECSKEQLLTKGGYYGLTVFHLLVWHNFYDVVEKMLNDGRITEEVSMPDLNGNGLTPVLISCMRGNLRMARLLIDHGADTSACDKRGMNAYHFLAYPYFEGLVNGTTCMANSVEQRGAIARLLDIDVNQKDAEGFTPLVRMLSIAHNSYYTWPLTEIFLQKGAKTDYVDGDGYTLLMMALKNGHMTAALNLMDHCKELVNVANNTGKTPFQYCADFRYGDAIRAALIDHGATPDAGAKHMDMKTLCEAARRVYMDIQDDNRDNLSLARYATDKMLKQIDPDDDDELNLVKGILSAALRTDREYYILEACRNAGLDFLAPIYQYGEITCLRDECLEESEVDIVKKLMELGVDINEAVVKGRTPVNIIASMRKMQDQKDELFFEEAAKLFSKESMEQTDHYGVAAIHNAAKEGHTGMLKAMIEKGVDINLTEDMPAEAGTTALHEACSYGHADVVRLLIDAGADDTMKNLAGETPAHFAVMEKKSGSPLNSEQRTEVLKELKNLDIAREDGKTPLMLLAEIRVSYDLLSIFIDRGVDINHVDNEGMNVMMLYTDKDFVKQLVQAGVDINIVDNEGNNVLHYVLRRGSEETARYLIKKGADYNRRNNRGETPAQLAVEKGCETVLELMTDIE